jgi:hypothetical protein
VHVSAKTIDRRPRAKLDFGPFILHNGNPAFPLGANS